MTKIERVKKVCKWLIYDGFADNDTELASKMGYTKSSLSQIMTEKVPISDKFIDNLCKANQNINKVWILDFQGTMLKKEIDPPEFGISSSREQELLSIIRDKEKIIEGYEYKIAVLESKNIVQDKSYTGNIVANVVG